MNEDDLYRTGPSGVITTIARCVDPTHRSYSNDKRWDECQFASNALDSKAVTKTWPAKVAVGSAVDEAVRLALLGEPVDLPNLVRKFFHEYGSPSGDLASGIGKAERLYALWDAEVRPEWERIGVYAVDYELHFEIDGIVYHVHIDVILTDGTVIDLKTSDQRLDRNIGRADFDVQLTTYCYSIVEVFGHMPPKVVLDGLIDGNPPSDVKAVRPDVDKPWWDRQQSTRTAEQMASFREDVRRREASRRFARTTGIYQTNGRAHPWACNSCPAKALCPSWQGFDTAKGSIANAA